MATGENGFNDPASGATTFVDTPEKDVSASRPPAYNPISIKFRDEEDDSKTPGERGYKPTRETFTRWVTDRITAGVDQRRSAGFDDRARGWRNQYEGVLRRKDFPWPGCSNLHIPITRSIVDALHAHMYRTLFGISPLFQGTYDGPASAEDARTKSDVLEWIARDVVKLPEKADITLGSAFIDGTAIQRIWYKVKIVKTRKLEQVTPELRAELMLQEDKVLARQLADAKDGEWRIIYREEITEDRAEITDVDILDFVLYPVDAPDMDSALVMAERHWETNHQLWEGVKSGRYDYDATADLTSTPSQGPERHAYRAGGQIYRYQAEGLKVGGELTDFDKPYEIFLGLVRYDVDGDGLAELVLVEVETATNTLLRAELYPYFHDRPFFVAFTPFRRKGFFYGYALPQIITDIQAEANALHNSFVDNNTLRNTPTFFYNRSAKWNPARHPFSPGMAVAVDGEPDKAIRLMEFAQIDPKGYDLVNYVLAMAKEVTGVNSTILSQPTGGDITAQEIERTLQSSDVKFDVIADRLRLSFEEAVQQIAELYAQYAHPDMTYPAGVQNGTLVFKTITRQQMLTRMGFRLRGTSALSNPAVMAQRMEKLVMFATQTPMGQQFILSDPEKSHALAEAYIRDGAGVEDPGQFLITPEQLQQIQANTPPPPPEIKYSVSLRADEVTTLTVLRQQGIVEDPEYLQSAALGGTAGRILPQPASDSRVEDATDNAAGYNKTPKGGKG